ncbi:hypothetical protein ACYCFK_16030 [Stutzerimonas stutzeri]|uniref:hypothetical protein n=1 Tax=Stutzerimonas stutzeri TaxID=316 RepID=UPI0015E47752|nr:hypothetical protein [Stutzerimonas stutzeri]MBA1264501.1 hypothetical protein [Stutzerimonas stutzeri]
MRKKIIMGLLAGSTVLGGCVQIAEAPRPSGFPLQDQQHVRAASHWQLIAEDTARQLIAALPEKRPLHVVRQDGTASPFEETFTSQLVTELTRAGYPVMKHADRQGTLLVEVSANPVRFSEDRRYQESFLGSKTLGASLLTGGLLAVYKVTDNIYGSVSKTGAAAGAVIGVTALAEALELYQDQQGRHVVPQTELIVTTSVSTADRYFAQVSSAYYTTQTDWGLYARNARLPLRGAAQ